MAVRGLHVAFEGVDGSGLTTHSRMLVEWLRSRGARAEYFKEPTRGPIGSVIRGFLSRDSSREDLLALLFAADRVWNYYEADPSIRGVVSRGGVAVSDRYKYSSVAYQGSSVGYDWVWMVNSRVPPADIVVFIYVPLEVALARLRERDRLEYYETRERLARVAEGYRVALSMAREEGSRVIVVDAAPGGVERSVDDVQEEIRARVAEAAEEVAPGVIP